MDTLFGLVMLLSGIVAIVSCAIYYSNQTSGGGTLGIVVGFFGTILLGALGTAYSGLGLGALLTVMFAFYWIFEAKDVPYRSFGGDRKNDSNRGDHGGGDGGGGG